MADETQPFRGINWRQSFPFINIFRGFRVAIHPSKLLLALAALLLLYVGGRILDGIWPEKHLAVPREIQLYEESQALDIETFDLARRTIRAEIEREHSDRLLTIQTGERKYTREEANEAARDGDGLDDIKDQILAERDKQVQAIEKSYDDLPEKSDDAERIRDQNIRAAYAMALSEWNQAKQIEGVGLFSTFYDYEVAKIKGVVEGVLDFRWIGPGGVISSIYRFFGVGPVWALRYHPVYFILFALYFLVIWAIFGGAISRIAAVHVAREEKISVRQALSFSIGKFLSFVSAPLIPLLIVLFVGLIVAAAAFLGNVPYIGPIVIGALYFLALVAGFVMTLVLLGTIGGFNMMYPTIAAEGSDSFDAISRSFSYLYARPWRLAFYTVVAIVYGALTYMFVRLFVFVTLLMAHRFTDLGMFINAQSRSELWTTLWPIPRFEHLTYDIDFLALNPMEDFAAFLIAFWVFLTIALIGAYIISFYFSVNTIIYFLMRSEVDATEMEDVYLEQTDEEFTESAAPSVESSAAAGAPAAQPPSSPPSTPPTPPGGTMQFDAGASHPQAPSEPPVPPTSEGNPSGNPPSM